MFKVLTKGCEPTRGSKYSAHVDLYASEDWVIGTGETKLVGLGVCVDLQLLKDKPMFREDSVGINLGFIEGEFSEELFNEFKSSHCLQLNIPDTLTAKGVISNNRIIDLDNKGEIGIIIHNPSHRRVFVPTVAHKNIGNYHLVENDTFIINRGDHLAQIALMEHKSYLFGISN